MAVFTKRGRLMALVLLIQVLVPSSDAFPEASILQPSALQASILQSHENFVKRADPPADPFVGLTEALEKARVASGVPGMGVAVVHKGKIIYAEGFGKRNAKDPFTVETMSPIASMTKAVTSAVIGEVVAEGKLDWDITPVSKYLPEFQFKDPALDAQFTLDDLLSHRTGLPRRDLVSFRSNESRRDVIKRLRHMDLTTKRPRSTWIYSNSMFDVAGEAVANVAGVPYEELAHSKVLKPLGMTKSGFSTEELRKKKNFALPHTAATYEDAVKGNFTVSPLDKFDSVGIPSGGMHSNLLELATWATAMMNQGKVGEKQILNPQSVAKIMTAHSILPPGRLPEFSPTLYGLGWMIASYRGHHMVQHGGALRGGYRSNIATFPDDDMAVIHLTNSDLTFITEVTQYHIADHFFNLSKDRDWLGMAAANTKFNYDIEAQLAKGNYPEQIPNKPAQHKSSVYVGDFTNEVYGDITVRQRKGKLVLRLRQFEATLEHLHFEFFKAIMKDQDVNLTVATLVEFQTNALGVVDSFTVDARPLEDIIVFKRK